MLFKETSNSDYRAYDYYGAHIDGNECVFRIWAPHAEAVYVYGDFNKWVKRDSSYKMTKINDCGDYELIKTSIELFSSYKYLIISDKGEFEKTDPYAFCSSTNASYASKIYDNNLYEWKDQEWIKYRKKQDIKNSPLNIYECHIGSWRREQDGSFYSFKKTAEELVPYVKKMGYTHIELLPVMEHPFYGSLGYEICGYYSPSSRFGSPEGLKYFVDYCHRHGIGVIFDWMPAHFPKDAHGLYNLDGYCCYEYEDEMKREQPAWGTVVFNFGKKKVREYLISNALFWIEKYHADGLRVDAVSSMLYLDFGREPGKWQENEYGGRENLEALDFLRDLNKTITDLHNDVFTVAEESSAWQMMTRPVKIGGLGFTFKWNMGWTNDTIEYAKTDPYFRKDKHYKITFPATYAFSENYILPISHDDVSIGNGSLLFKMPGDLDNKVSNLKAFMGYMIAFPGKKLIFMGNEFACISEWDHNKELSWNLLNTDPHSNVCYYFRELNLFYLDHPALWQNDCTNKGFQWISNDDKEQNIIAFIRKGNREELIFIFNFAPVIRYDYRIGVPYECRYEEIFTSDSERFCGNGIKNGVLETYPFPMHGFTQQISLTLPPLSVICLKIVNN